ncbi:MAG: amidohydrolase, partial [Deltaproteobacteria bacterium]|nr:amidohydrolase [Deltaproteobacteria bacterium]
MKIFDFNIHLPLKTSRNNVDSAILNERSLTPRQLLESFRNYLTQITANCDKANLMIFNEKILNLPEIENAIEKIKTNLQAYFTFLINFRSKEAFNYIDKIKNIKGGAIKFHSYVQHIGEQDFSSILKLCKYAEEKNLIICIDASYGTFKMYDYDNLKLAAIIIEHIKKTPIILLHSGGKRILEAFLLAESGSNIYLETSFTLNSYI